MHKKLPYVLIVFLFALALLSIPKSVFAYSVHKLFWHETILSKITSLNSEQVSQVTQIAITEKTVTSARLTPTPTTSQSKPTIILTSNTTATPSPTKETSSPTPTSSNPQSTTSTNDVQSFIISQINAYRTSLGLATVKPNNETCNFAALRAKEIATSFSHDGFNQRISSHTLPYASWSKVTENIAMTSDYKSVETMWQNSPGHAENMRADTPYVCVVQEGNYFAYEGLKP
jgi:uncharacterized protein YkwD